jgi:hypothetical protein
MIFKYIKFWFFLFVSFCFYFIWVIFWENLWQEVTNFLIFPLVFLTLNYAFLKLITYYIRYYNNLIIFYKQQIIVIKSSLIWTDNVEITDLHKITKIDTFCNWIMPNLIWYWTLVIEQQREEVREFWYVPQPQIAICYLNDEREKIFSWSNNWYNRM